MMVNGILLTEKCKTVTFFQSQQKEDIQLGYDQECLRFVFEKTGMLNSREAKANLDLNDSYILYGMIRLIVELNFPKEPFLEILYEKRKIIEPTVIISLFQYIGKTDTYKALLEEIHDLPSTSELPEEFLMLLMQVKPYVVLEMCSMISIQIMRRIIQQTYFDVSTCRQWYGIIRRYIQVQDFKIYLDNDDSIYTHIVDNKIELYIEIAKRYHFVSERTFYFESLLHPIYVGMHVWNEDFTCTYVIEHMSANEKSVHDTLSNTLVTFDRSPSKGCLFLSLSSKYVAR